MCISSVRLKVRIDGEIKNDFGNSLYGLWVYFMSVLDEIFAGIKKNCWNTITKECISRLVYKVKILFKF